MTEQFDFLTRRARLVSRLLSQLLRRQILYGVFFHQSFCSLRYLPDRLAHRLILAIALQFAVVATTTANEWDRQLWATAKWTHSIDDKAFIALTQQGRFNNNVSNTDIIQTVLSSGVRLDPTFSIAGGYERFRALGRNLENRVWGEVTARDDFAGVPLAHRLRVESRFFDILDDPLFRVRYRIFHKRPFPAIRGYYNLSNEFFFHLNDEGRGPPSGFDQNRLGGALGFPIGSHLTFELGYQWRFINTRAVSRNDHMFLLNLLWRTSDS